MNRGAQCKYSANPALNTDFVAVDQVVRHQRGPPERARKVGPPPVGDLGVAGRTVGRTPQRPETVSVRSSPQQHRKPSLAINSANGHDLQGLLISTPLTSTILSRTGQCLAAAAFMTGITFAASPAASADPSSDRDIEFSKCGEQGGSFQTCCNWLGGTYHPSGDPTGRGDGCSFPDGKVTSSDLYMPPTTTKPGVTKSRVAPPAVG